MHKVAFKPWPEDGCTLLEAAERITDPKVWEEWRRLVADPRSRPMRRFGSGFDDDERSDRHRLRRRMLDLEKGIHVSIRDSLRSTQFVATGRLGTLEAERMPIAPDLWPSLIGIDWETSAVLDGLRGGTVYRAVRVQPALHALNRAELLEGRSFADVMQRFVLQDPEVALLAASAIKTDPKYRRVFIDGCYPTGDSDEWPLGSRHRTMFGVFGEEADPDSMEVIIHRVSQPSVVAASEAVMDRFLALLGLLREGIVEGYGVSTSASQPPAIPLSIWSHSAFWIGSRHGDIVEERQEGDDPLASRFVKRWSAIMLRQRPPARPVIAAGATALKTRAAPTRTTYKRQELVKALAATGIDLVDSHLGPKQIAVAVMKVLPSGAYASEGALKMAIGRLRKELRASR